MVLGLGMRTVWISLRAMNYTDQAFRAAIGNLDKLQAAERQQVKAALQMAEIGKYNIQVGMLYAATITMMAMSLWQMLASTEAGQRQLAGLNTVMQETKSAFADTLFGALRPLIDAFTGFLMLLRDNEPLRILIILIGMAVAAFMMMYSVYKVVTGAIAMYNAMRTLQTFLESKGLFTKLMDINLTNLQTMAYFKLAIAVAAATGGFMLAYLALRGAPPIVSAIIAVVLALAAAFFLLWAGISAATLGIGALLGGAALGAALAAASSATGEMGFARGTRALPATGLFFGHRGEMVYNPLTGSPTGVRDLLGEEEEEPSVTTQDIDINIEHLHTEATFDEIDEKLGRKLRTKMRGNR